MNPPLRKKQKRIKALKRKSMNKKKSRNGRQADAPPVEMCATAGK